MSNSTRFLHHVSQIVSVYDELQAELAKTKSRDTASLTSGSNLCTEDNAINQHTSNGGSCYPPDRPKKPELSRPVSFGQGDDPICYNGLDRKRSVDIFSDDLPQTVSNWQRVVSTLIASDMFKIREMWKEDVPANRASSSRSSGKSDDSSETISDATPTDIIRDIWEETQPRDRVLTFPRLSRNNEVEPSQSLKGRPHVTMNLIMNPLSRRRLSWLLFGILSLTVDFVVLSLQVFGLRYDLAFLQVFEWCSALYWALDIGVSFITGVSTQDKLVMDIPSIARIYIKTWFLFDFSLVISQWLALAFGGLPNSGVLRYIRGARYTRLLRVAKLDQIFSSLTERFNSILLVLAMRMSLYMFGVVVYVHITGTLWYWVGKQRPDGWTHSVFDQDSDHLPLNYFVSVYWSVALFSGGSNIYPGWDNALENCFALCQTLISVIVLAILVSKLTNALLHIHEIRSAQSHQLTNAKRYLEQNEIDLELSTRVRKYVETIMLLDERRRNKQAEGELFQILPRELRQALLLQARAPIMLKHLVFQAFRRTNLHLFERLLCEMLRLSCFLPDENIFSAGTSSQNITITTGGTCNYFKHSWWLFQALSGRRDCQQSDLLDAFKSRWSVPVPPGMLMCEATLWLHWNHRGDFDSTGHANAINLEVSGAERLIELYPVVRTAMANHARTFSAYMLDVGDVTDLCTSSNVLTAMGASFVSAEPSMRSRNSQ